MKKLRTTSRVQHIPKRDYLTRMMFIIAIAYPFTTLPQILAIWTTKNAVGVSMGTWLMYFLLSIPLFAYSMSIKNKPYSIMHALWIIAYGMVVLGVLLYS